MTNQEKQRCINVMDEHLYERFELFLNGGDRDTAQAIMSEWVLDPENPDDEDDYEFMFIEDLTEV
jgi:hypothetical protein